MWSEVQIMSPKHTATEERFVKNWKEGIEEKDWDDDPDETAIPLKKKQKKRKVEEPEEGLSTDPFHLFCPISSSNRQRKENSAQSGGL